MKENYRNPPYSNWQAGPFLKHNCFAVILTVSLFIPFTFKLWRMVDTYIFILLNKSLDLGKGWQLFWAISNHKVHDWLEDVIFLAFMILYVKKENGKSVQRKIAECVKICLLTAVIITFINKMFIREYLVFDWPSPTMVFTSCNRISQMIPWLEVKDMAKKCFPGDHATTAVLFGTLFAPLVKGKMRYLAIAYSIFLCLPRLVAGAHWFSDIAVGSVGLGLLAHAFFYYTPIYHLFSGDRIQNNKLSTN